MARVQVRSLREHGAEYYNEEQLEHLAPPDHGPEGISDAVFQGRNRYAVVAERDGEVVGFAVTQTDEGYLSGIFVDPDAAGEGLGRKLLTAVEDELRDSGINQLTTLAALNAVEFYEACGFTAGNRIDAGSADDLEMPAVEMKKSL